MPHTAMMSWGYSSDLPNDLMKYASESPNYPLITEHYCFCLINKAFIESKTEIVAIFIKQNPHGLSSLAFCCDCGSGCWEFEVWMLMLSPLFLTQLSVSPLAPKAFCLYCPPLLSHRTDPWVFSKQHMQTWSQGLHCLQLYIPRVYESTST